LRPTQKFARNPELGPIYKFVRTVRRLGPTQNLDEDRMIGVTSDVIGLEGSINTAIHDQLRDESIGHALE